MKKITWKQRWNPDFAKQSDKERKQEIHDCIVDANGPGRIKVTSIKHLGNGVWKFTVVGSERMIQMVKEAVR